MTGAPQPEYRPYEEDEISLLDIGVTLARKRSLIVKCVVGFAVVGFVMALSAPPEYRSSMIVMSELGGEGAIGGGLGSTLRSFGFSLPGGGSGGTLSAQAIPDIVSSRQVRLAVARDTFYFAGLGEELTLVEYLDRDTGFSLGSVVGFVKAWTIGLPGKIVGLFRASAGPSEGAAPGLFLSEAEEKAIEWLSGVVLTSEDLDSGLITISATVEDPLVASQIVASVAENLRLHVRRVYTSKTRQSLEFVDSQFEAAREELRQADQELAAFRDRNQALTSSRAQLEEQRLQAQLTQAQIELQKSEPVITATEEPVPPLEPSGPNRKLTVLLALILGGMVGVGLAFVGAALERGEQDPEDAAKLAEIKAAVSWRGWFARN